MLLVCNKEIHKSGCNVNCKTQVKCSDYLKYFVNEKMHKHMSVKNYNKASSISDLSKSYYSGIISCRKPSMSEVISTGYPKSNQI